MPVQHEMGLGHLRPQWIHHCHRHKQTLVVPDPWVRTHTRGHGIILRECRMTDRKRNPDKTCLAYIY